MQDHQTIFSVKELRNNIKGSFLAEISDKKLKLNIIDNWRKNISSGKYINAKEEEISPIFLTQFFGDILGYEYNNPTDWNLRLENKTEKDSTKSDAALGFFKIHKGNEIPKDVRVVIEIKNAKTALDKPQNRKDFKGSPVEQAFRYASKIGEKCKWVIVSNFLEIRLYLANDMTKYEHFDIMSLSDDNNFARFYYLLSNGRLFLKNSPSTIDILLSNRIEKEKTITQEFYEQYHFLRELFFHHLKTHNAKIPPLKLLEYAQTIIDRIIFISVVKDYELVPYNVLRDIEEIAKKSWAKDKQELWRQLKDFFVALDEGLPPRIHKFNGGLFRQNQNIDNLIIKDVFLIRLLSLNRYDFESDLNVNILGHIFEQSISDIEQLKKEISQNQQIEYKETETEISLKKAKQKTNKRKKEGVFYTPEYITLYIVKQTIGAWLDNKKNELGLNDLVDFSEDENDKENQISVWKKYIQVLKNIKIIDPACGSGAFLTQAFDYLLAERKMVLDVIGKLETTEIEIQKANGLFSSAPTKLQQSLSQIKKDIVNNNIFGVDLNAESVEITKLGLWLKSASKKDPLALLDNNIKCGNSLISDKSVSDKAFDWNKQFPEIMKAGGFDIVVGNPPYIFIRELISNKYKNYYKENFENIQFKLNTYILFVEKSFYLLNKNGYFGNIIPNTWLTIENTSDFRKFILTKTFDIKIVNSRDKVFKDANVDTAILTFSKSGNDNITVSELIDNKISLVNSTQKETYKNSLNYIINYSATPEIQELLNKINKKSIPLSEIANICDGVLPYEVGAGKPKQTKEIRNKRLYHSYTKLDKTWLKLMTSIDIRRYFSGWSGQYIKYGKNLGRSRNENLFQQNRILVRHIPAPLPYSILATYAGDLLINDNNSMIITINSEMYSIKYILALINSKLISFWFSNVFNKLHRKLFPQFIVKELSLFPIVPIKKQEQQELVNHAEKLISINKKINDKVNKFTSNLNNNFDKINITTKIREFYKLDFIQFSKELNKQKIKITLKEREEWSDYFKQSNELINELIISSNEINIKIDFLVYKLFNLNENEINLIEKCG